MAMHLAVIAFTIVLDTIQQSRWYIFTLVKPLKSIRSFLILSLILLIANILFLSCSNNGGSYEETIDLNHTLHGPPVIYETEHAQILMNRDDVITILLDHAELESCKVFGKHLIDQPDTIKIKLDTIYSYMQDTVNRQLYGLEGEGDTIVELRNFRDERNYYPEALHFVAHELLQNGKCLVISKADNRSVDRIRISRYWNGMGSMSTYFSFENDSVFFSYYLLGL